MQLIQNPRGNYRFLTGIAPYSSGVAADDGYEIIHATMTNPVPFRRGFEIINEHLKAHGRQRQALCAIELRSPEPFSFEGFSEFNQGYQDILIDWDLIVDGINPIARTNIAPEVGPPEEPCLYAFSYTIPCKEAQNLNTFVVAGAGELTEGSLSPAGIVRAGETGVDAMRKKAAHVMGTMEARLFGLKLTWEHVKAVDIYTVHPLHPILEETILKPLKQAVIHGLHWFYGRPPIIGLEFEMDMRGIRRDIRLDT